MFSTEGAKVDTGFKTPQFIDIGPQKLMITSLIAVRTKDGSKFKVQANLETEPLKDGFEGWEGAKGQIGRVDLSIYTDGQDSYINDGLSKMATIAKEMKVDAQLNQVKGDDIDSYLEKASKVFANKYAYFLIGADEYESTDKEGAPRIKKSMKLPRYGYVAATEPELKAKMKGKEYPTMDSGDWFYKKVAKMDADEVNKSTGDNPEDKTNDLPF